MRPANIFLQILSVLLALLSALMGLLWLLLAVLFFTNFHFGSLWHCLVFVVTCAAPLVSLAGSWAYFRWPTWTTFGLSLAGSAFIGVAWLLWTSPLSRGLIH